MWCIHSVVQPSALSTPRMFRHPKGDPLATWPSAPPPSPPACFSHQCLCPAGCLAKAWCPSVTTSAGTSSGESWTWPSAAGECGRPGSVGPGWAGRCRAAGLLGRGAGGAHPGSRDRGRRPASGARGGERSPSVGGYQGCDKDVWTCGGPCPPGAPPVQASSLSSGLFILL